MSSTHVGVALWIRFDDRRAESSWLKKRQEVPIHGVSGTPREVAERFRANPLFIVGGTSELTGAVPSEEGESHRIMFETYGRTAALKGARVEVAIFPLEGDFTCRVWNARSQQFVDRPPSSAEVKNDFRFSQKGLLQLVKDTKPEALGTRPKPRASPTKLQCGCGASVQPRDTRCAKCGRSFTEALWIESPPPGHARSEARHKLEALGVRIRTERGCHWFTELLPKNAAEDLTARGILERFEAKDRDLKGVRELFTAVSDWVSKKGPVPRLKPFSPSELASLLEEARELGFPPKLAKKLGAGAPRKKGARQQLK